MLRYADLRLDASTLQELPDGGLRVTAQLTHPGIFDYRNPNGSLRREYRPADEVFRADAMRTFAGTTLTVNHPVGPNGERLVTSASWKAVTVGHVGDNVREDAGHVVADLYIRDPGAIKAIRSGGMKHISCGYNIDFDPTPGMTPEGQRYDGVQRNMRGNHVALLPVGVAPRGGAQCVLRLDSNGDELKSDVDIETLKVKIAALEGELDRTRTDAAEANAQIARLSEGVAPARLDALVGERASILVLAKSAGVDTKGTTNLSVKREIVAKRTPALAARVDSMDDAAVDAVMAVYTSAPHPSLAAAVGATAEGTQTGGAPAARTDAATPAVPKVADLHAKFLNDSANAWKNTGAMPGTVQR